MKVGKCFVDAMVVGDRLRSIDPEKVTMLAESIAAIGLQQPISVWSPNADVLKLIAGRHRFEAFKKLGRENPKDMRWKEIDCVFLDMDDLDRQLWEIDENLCRADLTDMERAQHTAKRAEVVRQRAELRAKLAPNSDEPKKRGPKSKGQVQFVADTAKATGRSKKSVKRDKARGEKIAKDVQKDIAGTDIEDSGVQLDALAKATPDEQREAVKAVNLGHAKDVREVLPETERKKGKSRRTSAEIRLDNFNHAVRAIVRILFSLQSFDVPPLNDGQLSQVEPDLRNAAKALSKFIKTVQRAHDENQAS